MVKSIHIDLDTPARTYTVRIEDEDGTWGQHAGIETLDKASVKAKQFADLYQACNAPAPNFSTSSPEL